MANLKKQGVIEALTRNGKGIKIGEQWFTAFKAPQLKGAQKGDEVSFEYIEKEVGGATFLNIQGDITVVSSGGPSTSSSGKTGGQTYDRSGEKIRQTSIVRQNALTQANALAGHFPSLFEAGSAEEAVALVIEAAKLFEAYSSAQDLSNG